MKVAVVQGEWKTGQIWLNGEEVHPMLLLHNGQEFSWGSHNAGSIQLGATILAEYIPPAKALQLCDAFSRQLLAQLGQIDFRIELDIPAWIVAECSRRSAAASRARETNRSAQSIQRQRHA